MQVQDDPCIIHPRASFSRCAATSGFLETSPQPDLPRPRSHPRSLGPRLSPSLGLAAPAPQGAAVWILCALAYVLSSSFKLYPSKLKLNLPLQSKCFWFNVEYLGFPLAGPWKASFKTGEKLLKFERLFVFIVKERSCRNWPFPTSIFVLTVCSTAKLNIHHLHVTSQKDKRHMSNASLVLLSVPSISPANVFGKASRTLLEAVWVYMAVPVFPGCVTSGG